MDKYFHKFYRHGQQSLYLYWTGTRKGNIYGVKRYGNDMGESHHLFTNFSKSWWEKSIHAWNEVGIDVLIKDGCIGIEDIVEWRLRSK